MAAMALRVAKEQVLLQKELDEVGGVDAEITSKVGPMVTSTGPVLRRAYSCRRNVTTVVWTFVEMR